MAHLVCIFNRSVPRHSGRALGAYMKASTPRIRFGRLSAMLAIILIGSALLGCTRSRDREFAIISQKVDAHKVQRWAKQILKDYPTNTVLYPYFPGIASNSTMVLLYYPPSVLQDMAILRRMGPMIAVSPSGPSSNRCVSLLYAASFGFGGPGHEVEAGDETFMQATNAECVEWIPGVYFRYVHSP
jgi:hypothetical protein